MLVFHYAPISYILPLTSNTKIAKLTSAITEVLQKISSKIYIIGQKTHVSFWPIESFLPHLTMKIFTEMDVKLWGDLWTLARGSHLMSRMMMEKRTMLMELVRKALDHWRTQDDCHLPWSHPDRNQGQIGYKSHLSPEKMENKKKNYVSYANDKLNYGIAGDKWG